MIDVRPRDAGPRLRRRDRMARRPLPHPARVRGALAGRGRAPPPPRAAARAARRGGERSTSATSGTRQAGSFARDYLAGRGLGEEVCREFRLGLALGGDDARAQGAREGLHRARSCARPGSTRAARRRLLPAPARLPARRRARPRRSASRRGGCTRTIRCTAKYVNTPESELFTKGAVVYGLDKARAAIAREDRACVVEGNTDVIALRQAGLRAGRRVHGHRADRAAAARARPAHQAALARLRRRCRRRVGDAARDGARGRAGLRREGRRAAAGRSTRPTIRPGSRRGWRRRCPYVLTARRSRRGARRTARPAGARSTAFLEQRARLARPAGGLALGERPLRHADPDPRRRHRERRRRRRRRGSSRAGDRIERGALAGVIAHPELRPVLAEIPPEHFRDETSPRAPRPPRRRHAARRRGARAPRRARRLGAGRRGSTSRRPRSTCSGCASASSGPSSSRPTSSGRRSCARRSPGSRRRLRPWARVARPRTEPMPRRGDGHVPTVRRSGPCSALCCDWTTSFMPWPRTSRGEPYSGAGRDALPT